MKRILWILSLLIWIGCCVPEAAAAEAENISGKELVTGSSGIRELFRLYDGRTRESVQVQEGGSLTLAHEGGIGSLYLIFGRTYGEYTVMDETTGNRRTFGTGGYLHEFLDLEQAFGYAPSRVTVSFCNGDASLAEVYAFGTGAVPDWVQKWAPPAEAEADLVLFSTHGDDEQLFFAGMLPYYGAELGYNVQVVYMTDHGNSTPYRCHEMLDGLWAVGLRHYPVFGPFGDYNTRDREETYRKFSSKGTSREDILAFVVENIRRFRPKVAVGHDLDGEYGHGMHMVYAELLCEAVEIAADSAACPESAMVYGTWDVPKTYLHLYPENRITMDWDVPLESFDGMTAFEVTKKLGFPCHVSQQSYYSWYFAGMDTAARITQYSPREFGLYRSTVGPDAAGNDLFEHVTTHAQDALEAARLQEQAPPETEAREEPEEAIRQEPPQTVPPEPAAEAEPLSGVPVFLGGSAVLAAIFGIWGLIRSLKKKK